VADWRAPLALAQKAVADSPKSYAALSHHGALLYRAGRYQDAISGLSEADAAIGPDVQESSCLAYNWLFLAMAHHRIGDVEHATKWHDKAVQWIDHEMRKKPNEASATKPLSWNRRLTLELLRSETENVLTRKS
jgi:tetratricopeptide (TPR) repeat protein